MIDIEAEYNRRVDAMPMHKRVERAADMAFWAREMIARQIAADQGAGDDRRLKLEVAKRVYCADKRALALLEQEQTRVSR